MDFGKCLEELANNAFGTEESLKSAIRLVIPDNQRIVFIDWFIKYSAELSNHSTILTSISANYLLNKFYAAIKGEMLSQWAILIQEKGTRVELLYHS